MKVVNDVTELIGETPMMRINKLNGSDEATIYAKLEWYNAGGSVKDRLGALHNRIRGKRGEAEQDPHDFGSNLGQYWHCACHDIRG